jgi:hypothetical protein
MDEDIFYINNKKFTLKQLLTHPKRLRSIPDKSIVSRLKHDVPPIYAITRPITERSLLIKYPLANEMLTLNEILGHRLRNTDVPDGMIIGRIDLGVNLIDIILDTEIFLDGKLLKEPDHLWDDMSITIEEIEPETRTHAEIEAVKNIMSVPIRDETLQVFYMPSPSPSRLSTGSFEQEAVWE